MGSNTIDGGVEEVAEVDRLIGSGSAYHEVYAVQTRQRQHMHDALRGSSHVPQKFTVFVTSIRIYRHWVRHRGATLP